MSDPANGPMQGVRILDLGSMIAGPVAATILADQGADVIKVEPPGIGDVMRYLGATRGGVSGLFQNSNRGKRSLALDLKSTDALRIVHQLVAEADVVLHNYRDGVAERLGVDYDSLKAINPDIIYLWVNGFGAEGPLARNAAYDNVIQAFAGVAQSQADMETGEPIQYYQLFSDKLTALTGAQAVASALFARSQGRGGQYISLSMVDAVVSFLWGDAAGTATFLEDGASAGMNVARNKLVQFSNGWGSLAPVTDAQFHACCGAFGVDSSAPEIATIMDRSAHPDSVEVVFDLVRAVMLETDVDEGIQRLNEADVPCAKAMLLADLPGHLQMRANNSFTETDHPLAGRMVEPQNPPNFSRTPSGVGMPSATLGEHTDEILAELGYESAAVLQLRDRGAVG
ncbi:MAG: CoA transferase [Halieaceae bacterium]|jgi:crotonobetainyl-CoA:carnitine CoA-transferase CaiB-like acyl-CoA transferase|nr:CoA transferase [Halieaceae bacterium]